MAVYDLKLQVRYFQAWGSHVPIHCLVAGSGIACKYWHVIACRMLTSLDALDGSLYNSVKHAKDSLHGDHIGGGQCCKESEQQSNLGLVPDPKSCVQLQAALLQQLIDNALFIRMPQSCMHSTLHLHSCYVQRHLQIARPALHIVPGRIYALSGVIQLWSFSPGFTMCLMLMLSSYSVGHS